MKSDGYHYRYIFDDIEDDFKALDPYQKLWTWVLLMCIYDLVTGRDKRNFALQWVTDPENGFFDVASEALGYSPDCLRSKVLKINKDKTQVNRYAMCH